MAQHKINYLQEAGLPIALTSVDKLVQWGRSNSLWPLTYGLACCAIVTGTLRYLHHADLHACGPRTAETAACAASSARLNIWCLVQLRHNVPYELICNI